MRVTAKLISALYGCAGVGMDVDVGSGAGALIAVYIADKLGLNEIEDIYYERIV